MKKRELKIIIHALDAFMFIREKNYSEGQALAVRFLRRIIAQNDLCECELSEEIDKIDPCLAGELNSVFEEV